MIEWYVVKLDECKVERVPSAEIRAVIDHFVEGGEVLAYIDDVLAPRLAPEYHHVLRNDLNTYILSRQEHYRDIYGGMLDSYVVVQAAMDGLEWLVGKGAQLAREN